MAPSIIPAHFPFYPTSGYRASGSGGLGHVGSGGYSWSSSPDSASGVGGSYLYFNSSYVNSESLSSRAYAFPVRCKPGNGNGNGDYASSVLLRL